MSLLLCFFILLFSMSTIEVEKFKAAAASVREALGDNNAGMLPNDGAAIIAMEPEAIRQQAINEQIDQVADRLQEFVEDNEMEEQIVVSKDDHGVYLRMQDQALFSPGAADIDAASLAIVEQLGSIVDAMDLPVVISGHTDNIPIRSAVFPSNWELSGARAAGVARALIDRGHDPGLVAVEAFGEFRPIADNSTAEGRSQNRRVELYFSRTGVAEALEVRGEIPSLDGTIAGDSTAASESDEPGEEGEGEAP